MKNIMKHGKKSKLGAAFFSALVFLTALAFTMALSSCGGKDDETTKLNTASDIYKHITTLAVFPKMEQPNSEDIEDYFGIDLDRIKAYEVRLSSDATLADEIAVFELADEAYRVALVNILKQRLNRAANVARDYSPEQYDIILKSTVEEKGRFVFYVVNAKSESIVSELKKLIEDWPLK